jgi:hypothetical protein
MKRRVIAYWLIPAKSECELFRKLIHILAREFQAPPFEPHLTLFTAREAQTSPEKILQSIHALPIRLRILGTAFSAKFTKTLFLRLASNQELEKLVARLAREVKTRPKVLRDPHISLLYKNLPRQLKKELASTMKFRLRQVTFDSIEAIRTVSPVRKPDDIARWEKVGTKRLSG